MAQTVDVILESAGDRAVAVIRVVAELAGTDPLTAMDLVDRVPKVVLAGVDQAAADAALGRLTELGATARLDASGAGDAAVGGATYRESQEGDSKPVLGRSVGQGREAAAGSDVDPRFDPFGGGTAREPEPGIGGAAGGTTSGALPGGTAREVAPVGPDSPRPDAPQPVAWSRASLLPGLSGRFSVVRDLGAGGEADVLLVSEGSGALLVVKQYRQPDWAADEEVLSRLRAARAGHTLESWRTDRVGRHVLWLQEWGTDPATGLFYEVAEYVPGGSLGDLRGWPVTGLVEALTCAVSAFHATVGAHRDVKPANVLVRSVEGPVLVLADVGLSRAVGVASKRFSHRDGSAAYQSPESAQGQVSRAGDWWSVGMMIAQASLGYHPLALGDGSLPADQVLQAEVAQRDLPLHQIRDEGIRMLCRGLLTRDADQRWGAEQIRQWQTGGSPTATPGPGGHISLPVAQRTRPVWFNGADHNTTQALAAAFAADPTAAGQSLFEAKDQVLLDDLRNMLEDGGSITAQRIITEQVSGPWQRSLLRLLVELDANLPPVLAGQDLTPAGIALLAKQIIETGSATAAQEWALALVVEHDLWRIWRGLPGMGDAAQAAGRLVPPADWSSRVEATIASIGLDVPGRQAWRIRQIASAWMVIEAVAQTDTRTLLSTVLGEHRPVLTNQIWWQDLANQADQRDWAIAAATIGVATVSAAEAQSLEKESWNLGIEQRRMAVTAIRSEALRRRALLDDYAIVQSALSDRARRARKKIRESARTQELESVLADLKWQRRDFQATGLQFPGPELGNAGLPRGGDQSGWLLDMIGTSPVQTIPDASRTWLLLAAKLDDGEFQVFDAATGAKVGGLPLRDCIGIPSLAFGTTASGRLLLACADHKKVVIWDPVSGAAAYPALGNAGGVGAVSLGSTSSGRLLLACGVNEEVQVWDALAGVRMRSLPSWGFSLAFGTTTSGQLLLASRQGDAALIWDPVAGTQVGQPIPGNGHESGPFSLAFGMTGSGRLLLACGDARGVVQLWDPLAGTPVDQPLAGGGAVAFGKSPSGRLLLASAGLDKALVWTLDSRSGASVGEPLTVPAQRAARSLAFGHTDSGHLILACGSEGALRMWDPISGVPISLVGGLRQRRGYASNWGSVAFGSLPLTDPRPPQNTATAQPAGRATP